MFIIWAKCNKNSKLTDWIQEGSAIPNKSKIVDNKKFAVWVKKIKTI